MKEKEIQNILVEIRDGAYRDFWCQECGGMNTWKALVPILRDFGVEIPREVLEYWEKFWSTGTF